MKCAISVIIPALNEEKNLGPAIDNALKAFKDLKIDGEVIVVNDGSADRTKETAEEFTAKRFPVRLLNHTSPRGIGASFWDGVDNSCGDIVVMLPGDNENDPWEILRYHKLLEHVDIVIPFLFNRQARSVFRNALSFVYRFIINTTFCVNFNYTNGTVMYRKSILKDMEHRSEGFFFQTDILIRNVKKGYLFAEVPYRLGLRREGISKAVSFPSLIQVVKGYSWLVRDQYFRNGKKDKVAFSADSLTAIRRKEADEQGKS